MSGKKQSGTAMSGTGIPFDDLKRISDALQFIDPSERDR
jgi:hypothetical protein